MKTLQSSKKYCNSSKTLHFNEKPYKFHEKSILLFSFVGDCQLALACDMFIQEHGEEIIEKNLYRNFLAHMASLYDFGLVSPETVHKNIVNIRKIMSITPDFLVIKKTRELQLEQWKKMEAAKEEKLKHMKIEPSYVNVEKIDPTLFTKSQKKVDSPNKASPTKSTVNTKASTSTEQSVQQKSTNTPNKKTADNSKTATPHKPNTGKTAGNESAGKLVKKEHGKPTPSKTNSTEKSNKPGPRIGGVKRKLSTGN